MGERHGLTEARNGKKIYAKDQAGPEAGSLYRLVDLQSFIFAYINLTY
jgi:hypothetical protein